MSISIQNIKDDATPFLGPALTLSGTNDYLEDPNQLLHDEVMRSTTFPKPEFK